MLIKFTCLFDFQDLSVINTNYDNGVSSGRYWFKADFNYDVAS